MDIRKATLRDLDCITEFNYRLAWETEHKTLDRVILKKGVEALLLDPAKGVYYVAEDKGIVIAQIMYTYEWSDWRNGLFLWVQSVYVDEEYRNQGIFKALYHQVKQFCDQSEDIKGIRLYVEKENTGAKQTYSSLGMAPCYYDMYEYEKE